MPTAIMVGLGLSERYKLVAIYAWGAHVDQRRRVIRGPEVQAMNWLKVTQTNILKPWTLGLTINQISHRVTTPAMGDSILT